MNPKPTEQQLAIVDTAAKFATKLRAAMRATEAAGVSDELRQAWAGLDLLRMDWPSTLGGFEVGRQTKVMTLEALANGDAAATLSLDRASWICSPMLATNALAEQTTVDIAEQAARFAPSLFVDIDHTLWVSGDWIRGDIEYICGAAPDRLYVMQGDRMACVALGTLNTHHFQATSRSVGALHALGGASVHLDAPLHWVRELGSSEARRLRGCWRTYLAAVLVGLAEAASRQTREFCLERVTFGKKVAHHQAVAFLLADMEIAVEAARLLLWQEAAQLDAEPAAEAGHTAFVQAVEAALFVTNHAVQLHGSHGYVEDFPVEKWMREARAISLITGGIDAARADITAAMLARPPLAKAASR